MTFVNNLQSATTSPRIPAAGFAAAVEQMGRKGDTGDPDGMGEEGDRRGDNQTLKPGRPNGHVNGILSGGTDSSRIPVPTRVQNMGNGPMVIVNSPENTRRPSPMFKQALESRNGHQVQGREGNYNWTDIVSACKQQQNP